MEKVDMTNYVETPLPNVPKIGWDDPNAKEYTCANCNGFVGVPGRIYGLVTTWCLCGNPQKKNPDVNDVINALKVLERFFKS